MPKVTQDDQVAELLAALVCKLQAAGASDMVIGRQLLIGAAAVAVASGITDDNFLDVARGALAECREVCASVDDALMRGPR